MNLSFYRLDALVQTPHSSDSSLLSYLLGLYTSVKKRMARLTSQLVAQTEHNQMLPKLKIGLTAFGEKNNKQTNERTNEPQKRKQKQTNKQTTSKDDSQFPCNCKVYYFMKIWFQFFNVGYGVFGFLDHPLSPFYLIK